MIRAASKVATSAARGPWARSRLAHHRGYELAPTARELRYLRDSVRKATHDLSQATASRTGTGTRSG